MKIIVHSLMSHLAKLLLRIIMRREFVEEKGTNNVIYILMTLLDRTIEVNKDLFFID